MIQEMIAVVAEAIRLPGRVNVTDDVLNYSTNENVIVNAPCADRLRMFNACGEEFKESYRALAGAAAYLNDVEMFDAKFFGITSKEAAYMDPQQRLLLELTWEALERSGCVWASVAKSRTGVFVGLTGTDYKDVVKQTIKLGDLGAHYVTGNPAYATAGRLSYTFDLHGPSMTIDTACSSFLVALHYACCSLRSRESDTAIVASANLILSPDISVSLRAAGMTSRSGSSAVFSNSANGYVRGEGAVVVVLKRALDAIRDGQVIRAIVSASGVNQDGRTSGFTAPNGLSQQQLIRSVLREAGLRPNDISHVEAHGTGTKIGDAIELMALDEVFRGCMPKMPISSIKTHVGHLEAAAGAASLVKAVAMLNGKATVPHHLRAERTGTHNWEGSSLMLAEAGTLKRDRSGRAHLAISSFGAGGTNAHVIISDPNPRPQAASVSARGTLCVLTISAKTADALRELVQRYVKYLAQAKEIDLGKICVTSNLCRAHFKYRIAVFGSTRQEMLDQLSSAHSKFQINCRPRGLTLSGNHLAAFKEFSQEARFKNCLLERENYVDLSISGGPEGVFQRSSAAEDAKAAVFLRGMLLYRVLQVVGIEFDYVSCDLENVELAAFICGILTCEEAVALLRSGSRAEPIGIPGSNTQIRATKAHLDASLPPSRSPLVVTGNLFNETLKLAYESGDNLDWRVLHATAEPSKILLPTYPFQREPHWIGLVASHEGTSAGNANGAEKCDFKPDQTSRTSAERYNAVWEPAQSFPCPRAYSHLVLIAFGSPDCALVLAGVGSLELSATLVRIDSNMLAADLGRLRTILDTLARGSAKVQIVVIEGSRATWHAGLPPAQIVSSIKAATHFAQEMSKLVAEPRETKISISLMTQSSRLELDSDDGCFSPLSEAFPSLRLETAGLWKTCISLPRLPDARDMEAALKLLQPAYTEDSYRVTNGATFVPRLKAISAPGQKVQIDPKGLYLVTGGTGAIGTEIIKYLISEGAKQIAVLSRAAATEVLTQTPAENEVAACRIMKWQVDLKTEGASVVIANKIKEGKYPLRGIVHAAGECAYKVLAEITDGVTDDVCGAKINGAVELARVASCFPEAFFLCIGSVSSIWGAKGQLTYAVSNAFVSWICNQRSVGVSNGLCLAVGPFAGGVTTPKAAEMLQRNGINIYRLNELHEILRENLGAQGTVIIASVEWEKFEAIHNARTKTMLFKQLVSPPSTNDPTIISREHPAGDLKHGRKLAETVTEIFGDPTISLPPNNTLKFTSLGLDSMMAFELKDALAKYHGYAVSIETLLISATYVSLLEQLNELAPLRGEQST